MRGSAGLHADASEAAPKLSVVALDRGQVLALRRSEAQLLERLAGDLRLGAVADEIAAPPGLAGSIRAPKPWSLSNATRLRA